MPRPRITPIVGREVIPRRGQTRASLQDALEKVVAEGVRYAADYPPAPAGSTYVRTRTLGRSWDRRIDSGSNRLVGIVFSNRNIAPYNIWVQGPRQTMTHEMTGWHDIDDIADHMQGIMSALMPGAVIRPFEQRR